MNLEDYIRIHGHIKEIGLEPSESASEFKFESRVILQGHFSSADQSIIAFSDFYGDEIDGVGTTSLNPYNNKHTLGFVKSGVISE